MKNKTEAEILTKIKTGKVKMRPKWWFEVEKQGLRGWWLLMSILVATCILVIGIFVQVYNPKELYELGEVGRELFISDFPYWWLSIGIVFGVVSITSFGNIGENYKKTTTQRLVVMGIVVMILTILMMIVKGLLKF